MTGAKEREGKKVGKTERESHTDDFDKPVW
jgi:hypothetical protein